jgi:hypothetical protein
MVEKQKDGALKSIIELLSASNNAKIIIKIISFLKNFL